METDTRTPSVTAPALPDGMQDGFVSSRAGQIHFVHGGSGSPLVLIHGGHGCWVHWHANLNALSRQHTVFALDMPGFGQSADLNAARRLEDVAHEVGEAIDAIREILPSAVHSAPFHLAGFSFGSLVATTIALQRPQDVRSLLLINPPGLGEVSPKVKAIQARASDVARRQGRPAGLDVTLRELMLCQPSRADGQAHALLDWGVRNTRFVSRSMSRSTRLMPMLQALRMPAHVVLGENDPHQRHELAARREQLAQTLGKQGVSVFDGAAHWLQYDQPERFHALALSVFGNVI